MVEDQPTEAPTEDIMAEPEEEAVEPAKKLTVPQRLDRIEELLIKVGVLDAASLGR